MMVKDMSKEFESVKKAVAKQARRITDLPISIGSPAKSMIGGTTALWTVPISFEGDTFDAGHYALVTTNQANATGIIIVHRRYLVEAALRAALAAESD